MATGAVAQFPVKLPERLTAPNPDEPEPKDVGARIPDSEKLDRFGNSSEGL